MTSISTVRPLEPFVARKTLFGINQHVVAKTIAAQYFGLGTGKMDTTCVTIAFSSPGFKIFLMRLVYRSPRSAKPLDKGAISNVRTTKPIVWNLVVVVRRVPPIRKVLGWSGMYIQGDERSAET